MSKVSLVGAGPGDLSLLSLRALEEIKKADVIVYDNLIPKSILNEARLDAKLIYAGKEANNHYLKQNEINRLLVNLSKEFDLVVRLKGGDPYVFGRGGEEIEVLKEAGVDYEVISGISSPMAALASVGIPISHRDYASSFHIITGQEKKDCKSKLNYEVLTKLEGSLIFMMSLNNIKNILDNLLLFGKNPKTPLSIVSRGTYPDKKRYDFTIADLFDVLKKDEKEFVDSIKKPALMVVGEVASLNLSADKKYNKLQNKTILITGTRQFCEKLYPEAEQRGANAIKLSLIETMLEDEEKFRFQIENIDKYTYIIFTSPNGVALFFDYIRSKYIDIRCLAHLKFAVIGSETAKSLKKRGIIADFVPSKFIGSYLGKELLPNIKKDDRVVLFRARESNEDIINIFKDNNISYVDVPLYKTIIDYRRKDELNRLIKDVDYICISSGSGAKALSLLLDDKKYIKDKIISIGPSTSNICKKHSIVVYKTAKEYSAKGIMDVIEGL